MEPMRWNNADPNPGARPQTSVFRGDKGLDVANQNRASGGGRKMFLTSPYIDQALALTTRSMSAMAILRQQRELARVPSRVRGMHALHARRSAEFIVTNFFPKALNQTKWHSEICLLERNQRMTNLLHHRDTCASSRDQAPLLRRCLMKNLQKGLKTSVNRRSFMKRGLTAAGAATVSAGLLGNGLSAASEGPEEKSGRLTPGDAAILRFLAAAEILETDLWQQYNELGGIQDSEVPGGSGNPTYT